MTKKSIISLAIIGVMAAGLAGCNVHGKANVKVSNQGSEIMSYTYEYNNSENPSEIPSEQENNGVKSIDPEGEIGGYQYSIQADAGYWCQSKKPGYYEDTLDQPNSPYMFFITCGRRTTGGYGVVITDIAVDENGAMTVTVEFTKPGPDDVVTQEITYPCTVLSLDKYPSDITIKMAKGDVLERLEQ